MTIVFKKVFDWGQYPGRILKCIEIKGVLSKEELPRKYMLTDPFCFLHDRKVTISISVNLRKNPRILQVGNSYSEEEIGEILLGLRKCGDRLHEINAELKEQEKEWKGEVEYNI